MEISEKTLAKFQEMTNQHCATIQERNGSRWDLTDEKIYNLHSNLIQKIGNNYMSREFKNFIINDENKKVLRFLLYYFNNCRLSESVFNDKKFELHKNLLLIGAPGVGKTMLMKIFSDYTMMLNLPRKFNNISISQMFNSFRVNGNIDVFTYNVGESKSIKGNPFNVCLNDIGLHIESQKNYGTDLGIILDDFLYSRYELYQNEFIFYHLTSNLSIPEFEKKFSASLYDRMKCFNVINLIGNSKR